MKKILTLIFFIFFSLTVAFAEDNKILPSQFGKIINVNYVEMHDGFAQVKQVADVKFLSGDNKGTLVRLDNVLTGNPYYDIKLKKNMNVLLHLEEDSEGNLLITIEDVCRFPILIVLSLIFCGLLIYVGRKKGTYSLISIFATCIFIFYLLVPLILKGVNPVLMTILVCLLSTAITIYLVGGLNRKSTSATIGCILSLIFAGVLSIVTVKLAHLNGFTGEHSSFLYSAHPELNLVSIIVSMMILATLGAVMDVAMSIASTVNEIYLTDSTKSVKELFVSGMNVGRDIIGTMANTLILVYLGTSLPLLLLSSQVDLCKFLNLNQVVTEIASALIGSSAIVICVPITAIVASELIKKQPTKCDQILLDD